MSIRYQMKDHIMMVADYKTPAYHSHLASHIIISLGYEMVWQIEGETVSCHGICIGPNVGHVSKMPKEGTLVFLFMEISKYTRSIKEMYLQNRPYAVLPYELVSKACKLYKEKGKAGEIDELILRACDITVGDHGFGDARINQAVEYLEEVPTISSEIFDELSRKACLSKSRLSHLFHEKTGMTLHSYVAFIKLKKTDGYIRKGHTITESCMLSGFDSPSHCAATMKRIYGLSFSDVYKTMER